MRISENFAKEYVDLIIKSNPNYPCPPDSVRLLTQTYMQGFAQALICVGKYSKELMDDVKVAEVVPIHEVKKEQE